MHDNLKLYMNKKKKATIDNMTIWYCKILIRKVEKLNAMEPDRSFSLDYIYWNTLKKQHLIQCQFLPEDQIITVIDNEMGKSDQLVCIRYKNQNVFAFKVWKVSVTSRKF